MNCSKCGINDTHTTKYHDEQLRNAALFRLPAHHLWYITSGKVYQAATVAGAIVTLPGALSQLCRRRVACRRHVADIAKCRQFLADIACRCDTEEAPTYPIYINYS